MKKLNELRKRLLAAVKKLTGWFAEDFSETPALDYMVLVAVLIAIAMWSKPAWGYHPFATGTLIAFFLCCYAVWKWLMGINLHKSRAKTGYWAKFGTISLFAALFLVGATITAVTWGPYGQITDLQTLLNMITSFIGVCMMYLFGRLTIEALKSPPWA